MSQPYRHDTVPIPLISWCSGALLALDPMTGALLWEQKLEQRVTSMLLTDRLVVVATFGAVHGENSAIHLFDLATGRRVGGHEAPGQISSALRHGNLLVFGGFNVTMALRLDGTLVWSAGYEVVKTSSWSGDTHDLVARDANRRETWRLENRSGGGGALALGDQVAQPDFG